MDPGTTPSSLTLAPMLNLGTKETSERINPTSPKPLSDSIGVPWNDTQ